MAKRYIIPQQQGERKKAKLNITISDHNFPLSQNEPNKVSEQDNWGDDNDDEILLLASQACEDGFIDVGSLPDYSICMQPASTSTQLFEPVPSTSKAEFAFKKPSSIPTNVISTNLKDKCNRVSSPLPGMSSKMLSKGNENVNITDDLIFNEKIYKGQDSDHVYRQLLQLQEENAKLKSENGKLLEKCVTKEGEATILRTQLKTYQIAVDNARMEKIKAQEKVQMEWTDKLTTANGQMHDLRTQLDFKNLEIISIREKCKMLESNKVRLTQVTVPSNDINSSQRHNRTVTNDYASPARKVQMMSNSVQTEDKAHFLKLNKTWRSEPSKLTTILPLILSPTTDQHSILEYNEKLQKHSDLRNKCRIYSTFHRVSRPGLIEGKRVRVSMSCMYEDVMSLAAGEDGGRCFGSILQTIKTVLTEVGSHLELISRKMTTAFQKEMDERYIEATSDFLVVEESDLLNGKPLYNEEQATQARRMTALLNCILDDSTYVQLFRAYDDIYSQYIDLMQRICGLLDSTSCALLYSGLLLSITNILLQLADKDISKLIDIVRYIISSRPMPFVSCKLLSVLRRLSLDKECLKKLCPGGSGGNLRLDYDQGVLLYKKDSCYLQVLLKQIEASLKCVSKQSLVQPASDVTRHLLAIYSNAQEWDSRNPDISRCDCQIVLLQIIVYALSICAVMLRDMKNCDSTHADLLSICRSGIRILYQCVLRDVEFSSQLSHNEGHLVEFCEMMKGFQHGESYVNMLSEISSTFQPSPEESTSSFHQQAWISSFNDFTITE